MQNKEIARVFRLAAQLIELHNENPFKAKSYGSAAFKIDTATVQFQTLSVSEMEKIDGIGKTLSSKISEILETGSFSDLNEIVEKTPEGVLKMMQIKGIGPKKVSVIWKQLGIETPGDLLYACNENRLIELNGFGAKTQEQIKQALEFSLSNSGKFLYAQLEDRGEKLLELFQKLPFISHVSLTGDFRRKAEILDKIEFVISTPLPQAKFFISLQENLKDVEWNESEDKTITGTSNGVKILVYLTDSENYFKTLFLTTGHENFLKDFPIAPGKTFGSEENIFEDLGFKFIPAELRDGILNKEKLTSVNFDSLIDYADLKGTLHNHTTYSDGLDTLEKMATYCLKQGLEYLGICDHSKSAFYAGGLKPEEIIQQHKEIDELNLRLAPFKIFKGIESDILNDGSLDYPSDILESFDFVVASIHSNLKMNEEKATARLLKAIENPYTTILGHATGRLLLLRQGYPIDYKKIIDACAANNVIIELNANPYRLDIDWRWIDYILSKDVMISINPDAHRKEAIHDMYYGVCAARKGGLTKEMTFNALNKEQVEAYFNKKRAYV